MLLVYLFCEGKGGGKGVVSRFEGMADILNRDTANQRLPSFWKSTSFKRRAERGVREGERGGVRGGRTVLQKMECIL
jgi:hypothetical protein